MPTATTVADDGFCWHPLTWDVPSLSTYCSLLISVLAQAQQKHVVKSGVNTPIDQKVCIQIMYPDNTRWKMGHQ